MGELGNKGDGNKDEQPAEGRAKHTGRKAHWAPLSGQPSTHRLLIFQAKERDLGDDLLSQTVASPVPSALTGLTAVFGMGTGVSPSLWSPKSFPSIAAKKCFRDRAQNHAINLLRYRALRSEIDGQALDLLVPLS